MPVLLMRPKAKPEHREEVEGAIRRLFEAIHRAQPEGVRYASCRLPGEEGYLVLLELADETENPLPSLPEFAEFGANAPTWLEQPPTPTPLTVLGSYRLFDDPGAPPR